MSSRPVHPVLPVPRALFRQDSGGLNATSSSPHQWAPFPFPGVNLFVREFKVMYLLQRQSAYNNQGWIRLKPGATNSRLALPHGWQGQQMEVWTNIGGM